MILLFDLDRTLINTEKFKKSLSIIFGISLKEYESNVNDFFRKTGKHYTPEVHIKVLKKLKHIKTVAEEKIILEKYNKLLKRMDEHLFPGTENILNNLKKQGHILFLITLGVPSSQKRKINNSCLKKYFKKIIYETKNKSQNKFIKQLAKLNKDILIINDKAEEAIAIKKAIGEKAQIYLVDGPHSKNTTHTEKIYKNIKNIKNILQ